MTGFHFFVETNGGEWHRTENTGEPGSTEAARCSCRIAVDDARVLKVRGHDDDSWQWVPKSQLGACFPKEMRDENGAMVDELHPQDSGLDAALEAEVARVVSDAAHPSRIAYERTRAAYPNGGDEARAAFHRFLREEKIKRDAGTDRRAPKAPRVDEKTGVPMCSQLECPKYARFQGRCTEDDLDDPVVCIPAVRDMALELDARKDAADPAFDEIVKLCGLAKTWEYPGQVVRDVEDALKKKDDEKERAIRRITDQADREVSEYRQKLKDIDAVVEQNQKLQAALKYARDRRGNHFDFDEWIIQVEHALDNKIPPHAIENAQAKEAQAWAAINTMRADRDAARAELRSLLESMRSPTWQKPSDSKIARLLAEKPDPLARVEEERTKDLHVMSAQGKAIEELRAQNTKLDTTLRTIARQIVQRPILHGHFIALDYEQYNEQPSIMRKTIATVDELRDAIVNQHSFILKANEYLRSQQHTAFAIRDDARRASQRALDEKRALEAAGAELTALVAKLMPAESIPERAWLPFTDRDVANAAPAVKESPGQCPWIMPDEDPEEGYWHCKLAEGHAEKHVTEFGRGLDKRWYMPCEGNAHTFVGDCCRDCSYPAQNAAPNGGPTLGGEDLVGKSPEMRRAMISAVVMSEPVWAQPGLSAAEVRDAIIAEVGMMAAARTPEMQAAYDEALAREGRRPSRFATPRADGVVVRIPGHEVFIEQPQPTQACECSLKYLEIAPGVHAKYCPLAGLPLSDGRSRWRCEPCNLTFRSPADAPTEPIENCQQCGKPTTEVARG